MVRFIGFIGLIGLKGVKRSIGLKGFKSKLQHKFEDNCPILPVFRCSLALPACLANYAISGSAVIWLVRILGSHPSDPGSSPDGNFLGSSAG